MEVGNVSSSTASRERSCASCPSSSSQRPRPWMPTWRETNGAPSASAEHRKRKFDGSPESSSSSLPLSLSLSPSWKTQKPLSVLTQILARRYGSWLVPAAACSHSSVLEGTNRCAPTVASLRSWDQQADRGTPSESYRNFHVACGVTSCSS